ncbi:MAG: DUF1573 domain-containing protein [Opitutaceae bacterium]|jgi:hypothetical protein
MHLRTQYLALFVLPLFLVAKLEAGALTWKTENISVDAIEGQKNKVKEDFPFTNTSNHPVTITSVRTSCGCTTAALDKKTYAAGEKGTIAVSFDVAERTGLQEKDIMVTTDEANQPVTRLHLEINVKEYLSMTPRLLMWKTTEPPSEKLIVVSVLPSQPATDIQAVYGAPGTFQTRTEVVTKGLKYNVYVKPISTAQRINTIITFHAKFASAPERTAVVYVYVNPPGVSQTDD